MVFYLESSESGSMFVHLPTSINIYATTAANPFEPSYSCYYDELRHTYLGDRYSVSWLEDSEKVYPATCTSLWLKARSHVIVAKTIIKLLPPSCNVATLHKAFIRFT